MNDANLSVLWGHVDQNWDNASAHAMLLQHCVTPSQLAEVAKLYRAELHVSTRAAVAEQQLKRIAALAMAQLDVKREAPATRPPYVKYALIALFLLGSALLASTL